MKQIKNYRQKAGISQEELAKRVDVSTGTIQNYESGKGKKGPSIDMLKKIASVLNVPMSLLLDEDLGPIHNEREEEVNASHTHQVKKRLEEYLRNKNITAKDFGESIGKSQFIYNLEKNINMEDLALIKSRYSDLDISWLITGQESHFEVKTAKDLKLGKFKLIPKHAHAGYAYGHEDEDYWDSLPVIAFPGYEHVRSVDDFICVEMKGESMHSGMSDSYLDGDILLGKKIYNNIDLNEGNDYIILSTEGFVVKNIAAIKDDSILVHSTNSEFMEYEIPKKSILKIYEIESLVRDVKNNLSRKNSVISEQLRAIKKDLDSIKNKK